MIYDFKRSWNDLFILTEKDRMLTHRERCQLVSDEASAINFEDKDIVDYPCFSAIYEADAALVAVGVDRGADADAFVNVTGLGEELDVEGHTLDFAGGLGVGIAKLALTCEGVEPLPFLAVGAEVGVTLSGSHFFF